MMEEEEGDDAGGWRERGNRDLGEGRFLEAVEKYSSGLRRACGAVKDPDGVSQKGKLLSNRSLAYYRLGEWDAALRDAEETIVSDPQWEKGYIRKALVLIKMDAPEEVVLQCYEDGLKNVPASTALAVAANGASKETNFVPKEKSNIVLKEGHQEQEPHGDRVSWNEESLAKHQSERGVLYARMKIDQPDTPFLVYDEELASNQNLIGTVKDRHSEPEFVDIADLQAKLGILQVDQAKGMNIVGDKSASVFEQRRKEIYKKEGQTFKEHTEKKG